MKLIAWVVVLATSVALSAQSRQAAPSFPAPDPVPEAIAPDADFPYLPPLPATHLVDTRRVDAPLEFAPGASDVEATLVGTSRIEKRYSPTTISKAAFLLAYRDALIASGWKVRRMTRVGDTPLPPGIVSLSAMYASAERLLYAVLTDDDDGNYLVAVSDVGAEDWGSTLDRACRLVVYGVDFDFNRATIRGDAEPILVKLGRTLAARPGASFEIQGHLDNRGDDTPPLAVSTARAEAVAAWLTAHGVAKSALSFKGYGKTRPLMENDSDLGRARNRRIEVVKVGCGG